MRVKSCEASDNQNRPIELSDNDGCVLRPKMVSKFMKMRSTDPRATVVTYAFFHAFKFPDSMAVHIRYVTISPWNSHSCRLNLKPLKKPSGIKICVSKKLRPLFKLLPIADTSLLISCFWGVRKWFFTSENHSLVPSKKIIRCKQDLYQKGRNVSYYSMYFELSD